MGICDVQAVDTSASDFRAWYGLGQTYEMLHLYQYALYYFKKAASLKPADARMWAAVGEIDNHISQFEAISDRSECLDHRQVFGETWREERCDAGP